jgi:TPR repeat protein
MNSRLTKPVWKDQTGAINQKIVMGLAGVAVLIIAVIAYMLYTEQEESITSTPPPVIPPPVTSKQARPDNARAIINDLNEQQSPDYTVALDRAHEFREAGQLADAQLLFFYAARGGYAPAAFELGEMYDPNYFEISSSLMDKADPFQAYRWYRQAQQSGNQEAPQRLAALQVWANEAAANGNGEAERLLLQWE